MSAAVLKFPAARLAAKREARNERYQREFLNIWDQLPSEEHRDVVMAWAKLCAARDASEFAKARKAAIAAVQWQIGRASCRERV